MPKKSAILICLLFGTLLSSDPVAGNERNVRIVDYGADMSGFVMNPYRGQAPARTKLAPFMDKDGNGTLDNDTVSAWQFSLTEPLNFPYAPFYDLRQKNARFYGGLVTYAVNNPKRFLSEGFLNCNHEGCDDFNFMALGSMKAKDGIPEDEQFEGYALWFWQRHDFLNDGDKHPVVFNDKSFIAVHVSRYWGGADAGRWVIRDGSQFYVSEKTFGDIYELIDGPVELEKYQGKNPMTHKTFILNPKSSKWAVYSPEEASPERHCIIDFDAKTAKFANHDFKDVSAVGWLCTRSMAKARRAVAGNLSPMQGMAIKWYALRCDAVVKRPDKPSHTIPMETAGDLHISRPVSFEEWERIRRIGVTNQYCRDLGELGYSFIRDGFPAGMETDGKAHSTSEPVGGITWLDAVAWCNLLSEFEGLEPVYYSDKECETILRRVINRTMKEKQGDVPTVYWKKAAEGFRLPTGVELPEHGGAFTWEGPEAGAMLRVCRNNSGIGNEIVPRLSSPDPKPATPKNKQEILNILQNELKTVRLPIGIANREDFNPFALFEAQRKILKARDNHFMGTISSEELTEIQSKNAPPELDKRTPYELDVAATEIPYRVWNEVRTWGENNGYSFNYRGDMGSMRCLFDPDQTFSQDDPVAHIGWHDALVWCNALSELTGLRPAYYTDKTLKDVYRKANTFRLEMYEDYGYPSLPAEVLEAQGKKIGKKTPGTNTSLLLFFDADADGYRLPYPEEMDKINPGNNPERMQSLQGQNTAVEGRPMRTRPVAGGTPDKNGLYEINGNVLEWSWSPLDDYTAPMAKYDLNGYGCFSMTAEIIARNRILYQDATSTTRPYFGLRVVKRSQKK